MNHKNNYKDKIEYFDSMAHNWDEIVGNDATRKDSVRFIFNCISISEGMTILDVGCGNGILLPLIQEKTGESGIIHAIDPSPLMIKRTKELHTDYKNITYHIGTIESAQLPEKEFDVILCFASFPHFEDQTLALQRMRILLKDCGKLYIFHLSDTKSLNTFHKGLKGPVSRDQMPEKEELAHMLKETGFSLNIYTDELGKNFIEAVPC